jgi:hypothetical protein
MSAGYIQLAAIGQQDAYLTGSPQVTYFSGVYRRHTPFVLEAYDIPFLEQSVRYGQNNICRIPAKGDLIRGLTLKLSLPALNNPGTDWTWPTEPATTTNQPHIRINRPASGGSNTTIITTILVSSYSTNNFPKWFTTFSPYVSYDEVQNKFVFSNCASVEVENRSDSLAPGVFWGLDPRASSFIGPSGNLVYTVNSTSNLQANNAPSNTAANFISTVSRTGDFTLEQAGWIQSIGAIAANRKAGFFSYLNQPYNVSGQQFLNFSGTSGTGTVWTVPNQNSKIAVTPGGRIQFQKPGLYAIKAGFELGAGSIQTLSFGSSTNEATEGSAPTVPNFESTFTFRVSPDPSMPAVIPMNVTSVSNTYYFYVTSTGTQLQANSYVSINQVDEVYKLTSPVVVNTSPCKIQLYGNVAATSGSAMVLTPTSNINFLTTGEYILTGVVALASGYVSNVTLFQDTTLVYDYDMRVQGRDPTFAFSIPIVVTSLTANYFMNVTTTTTTSLLAGNTYFVVNRIGVLTTDQADPNILPENGISFRPGTTTLKTPLNFTSDFVASGNSAIISYTSGGFQFSNAGTYMMTGAICTTDPVTSITFGPQKYTVSLGLLPPYTFQVPIYIGDTSATYPVSLTVSGSSLAPNLFSNTFISVYPITSALPDPTTVTYPYYDSVGTWAIKSADLKIGGQTIQSLTGEFIELWNDLHVPYENQPGLTIMTGKNDVSTINPPGRTYFVNLPFYFYGHPSLYLPLVALDRHDVEVHVTFRNFNELTAVQINSPTLDATIITEYVYLSDPEINWFKQARLEYVITQCQYQSIGLLPGFQSAVFNLDFKNPVREMFFVVQPKNQLPYDYSNNAVLSFGLSFNGQEVFTNDTTDVLYTGSIEPFNHYPNFPQRDFFMYAFTAEPTSPKPAGQINFSRIKQVLLRLNCGGQAYLPEKELRILAVNYNILRIADGLGGLLFNT